MFSTRLKPCIALSPLFSESYFVHIPSFTPCHVLVIMVDMEEQKALQAFIADIEAVYKKHNMRITARLEVEDIPKTSVLV